MSASGSTNYFKRMMGIEEAPYEVVSHLGKKVLLPGLLDGMLYELDIQDTQKNDC